MKKIAELEYAFHKANTQTEMQQLADRLKEQNERERKNKGCCPCGVQSGAGSAGAASAHPLESLHATKYRKRYAKPKTNKCLIIDGQTIRLLQSFGAKQNDNGTMESSPVAC